MQRTSRHPPDAQPDYSPLIRAIQYLDGALQRGIVIGVYQDSREVSDEDIAAALIRVNNLLAATRDEIEKTTRSLARLGPGSTILQ